MTTSGEHSVGIHQTGAGRIHNSGAVAAGRGARASVVSDGGAADQDGPTPQEALAALRELLAEHGRELPDADRARARGEVEEVADELAAEEPDRGRLTGALDRLAAALSSVAVLAAAADALRTAMAGLLG
ncbi:MULTISPECIES: DUF5955 family protein [Streptomyces]|uniref:DUF5955 family protein n=1 Tax=Streptomyces lichenis TaxID=2306967 RepID=A0ABT0IDS8_9ACTN|nr:DUF5955 family protein [Streptomyces lichenis]MCK8679490.1 DUF5955 family protein [Streptomyces lichenis]